MPSLPSNRFTRQTVLFVAGYAILFLGMEYITPFHEVMAGEALWYPAAGLHLTLAVLIGYVSIPIIFVASLLSTLVGDVAITQLILQSIITALGYGAGGHWLRKQLTRLHPAGPDASEKFVCAVFVIPAFVAAGTLAGWLQLGAPANFEASPLIAITHGWLGAAVGVGTLTPAFLLILWVKVQPWIESIALDEYLGWGLETAERWKFVNQALAVVLGLVIAFGAPTERVMYEVCFFPVLWMAYRSRLSRASFGVLFTVLGCVVFSAFWRPITSVLDFQVFALTLFMAGALLGMLTSERRRAFRALQRLGAEDHLEDIQRAAISVDDAAIDADVEAIMDRLKQMNSDTLQYHVEGLLTLKSLLSTDVANLESRTEQLESLHKQKDAFFTGLSHEFKTPLTLIIGTLTRTRDGAYGQLSPIMKEQIDVMLRNAGRLRRLVDQILDLARLEAGHMELEVGRYDLVVFAREITHSFKALAEQQGISLMFESSRRTIHLYFQQEHLEKVIRNLLSNAIKFTPAGGEVEVSLRDEGPFVSLLVSDTGLGISEDHEPFVFDRFYQADSSSTRIAGGTGLGLALVKEIVDLHGGHISLHSSEGEGSTFVVRLKKGRDHLDDARVVSGEDHEDPATGSRDNIQASLFSNTSESRNGSSPTRSKQDPPFASSDIKEDQKSILVVDDNRDLRRFVKHILEPRYNVLEAVDGKEGLDHAKSLLPDLILADVMMPQLDGFEMNEQLKKEPATECIPVIFLTARDMVDDQIRGLMSGGDGYVTKPFDGDVLLARIVGLLRQRERLRRRFEEAAPDTDELTVDDSGPVSSFEKQVRTVINDHIADGEFTVEKLAEEVALSRRQLARKLKDEAGTTPARFIREVRLQKSKQLLEEKAGNISEIAYAVGFNSLSYFSRCFREQFGKTPSEYAAHA